MRFDFENYVDHKDDLDVKFAIDFSYFNDKIINTYRDKHNKWRVKTGFPEILNYGSYFYIRFHFGKRRIGVYITIRDRSMNETEV